jgi:hypothetical protein
MVMDISKLQVSVYEKTGIRLDRADPVFALVALNEAIIEDLFRSSEKQWAKNSSELDAKIGALVTIHEQILLASKELTGRVDQAHIAAALKAASEAKAEIFKAARDAVCVEVQNSARVIRDSASQLENARTKVRASACAIAIVQAAVAGMVAGVFVLAGVAIMTS